MMSYKEFKKECLFYNKKVMYEHNNINYYLFSKTMSTEHNEQNLINCYDYIKEHKKELLIKTKQDEKNSN